VASAFCFTPAGQIQPSALQPYPVLHRLERNGDVEARWEVAKSGHRRKYYRLTSSGDPRLTEERRNGRRSTRRSGASGPLSSFPSRSATRRQPGHSRRGPETCRRRITRRCLTRRSNTGGAICAAGRRSTRVRIGRGRQSRIYAAEVKKGLRPATLGAVLHQIEQTGKPPLLITDYVTPPLAEQLKARNIAFLDAAGNAYINQPPILVWIKGERPEEKQTINKVTGRAFQASGLKVLFALLCRLCRKLLIYRSHASPPISGPVAVRIGKSIF